MFTGLIEAVGTVRRVARAGAGARLEVAASWPDDERLRRGDSVAVNGACLTAVEPNAGGFTADISPETLSRTLLGELRPGAAVNLERALKLGDRLGGHLVQGHVDARILILAIEPQGGFQRWRLSLPPEHRHEVAAKGSVALDGVSLTVSGLGPDWFEVALIPETLAATTLGGLRVGAAMHLETDVLAKYVARRLAGGDEPPAGRSAIDAMFGGGGA
ncbi:MAG TPA: riboflavin synthase [Candidatus Sulfomarinibacteraceae bacterium]|nr:riboflavin synthase [Candidatus Sulfomarinibacteraceae bacterium]